MPTWLKVSPLAAALALVTAAGTPQSSVAPCSVDGAGDRSLYCIDLVPAPDFPEISGTVELGWVDTPFGVAVSPDGQHEHDLTLTLEGLPDPARLPGGPYGAYVAWVTTAQLAPLRKLAAVTNGRTSLGLVALNKFLVLITAEARATVAVRGADSRIVLRGLSPSNLLLPHDLSLLPGQRALPEHAHGHRPSGWRPPPMHPDVPRMIRGLEALDPSVRPYLPAVLDTLPLPLARSSTVIAVEDGDTVALAATAARRVIAGRPITIFAFNGLYPGPLIHVAEGATVVVDFTNRLDQPSTVHWHGVRLDNASDGAAGVTQEAVPPGGSFRYRIRFPDAGVYWYHPHVREDVQQDLGLYGNLFVRPTRSDYFGPAHREEFLILDDLLLDAEGLLPYGLEAPNHALMGRFGNVLLVNGEPEYRLRVRRGEVVRFFLTNAANTRTFNLTLTGARLKVVGSDVGVFAHDAWVDNVVIAPAERYIVEARFESPGVVQLENRVQAIDHPGGVFFADVDTVGRIEVADESASPDLGVAFERLRVSAAVTAEVERLRWRFDRAPDHTLDLTLRADSLPFGLVQVLRLDSAYVNPVEWSGTMPMMDWLPTGREVRWVLREPSTGRENMDVAWRFRRGDLVKLRLVSDRHTLHAMHHPVHVHGQRFLVLARNGVPNRHLVWKDTVLLPAGGTVDILLELANPGRWMLHCHIAEHLEAGMQMVFTVE